MTGPKNMTVSLRGTTTRSSRHLQFAAAAMAMVVTGLMNSPATAGQPQPMEVGLWYDETGRGAVELLPCGPKLCGRIAWLREQVNAEGRPLVDRYNPNAGRRTTPICGLQVIGDAQKMAAGSWDSGWIYDPKTGSSYSVALLLQGPDQLKVTGYKGMKLLSKSFIWKRAPADLPRCSTTEGGAETAPGGEALPWANR